MPKSCVRYTHGVTSPYQWKSNVAYAVAGSNRLGSTQVTHGPFGKPGTTTFVQCAPPSRVTCTLPSSVPTQTVFASSGDSLITLIVVFDSADELSTVMPPDSSCFCFSGSLVVRSGEIRCQVSPWSVERKRNCAPMYTTPFCVGLAAIGAFQLKRSFSL